MHMVGRKLTVYFAAVTMSLGCATISCERPSQEPDDPGAHIALATIDGGDHLRAQPSSRFDVGDWKAYVIRPDPIPTGYDGRTYVLVDLERQEGIAGEDAMRVAVEYSSDPQHLAELSLAFLRSEGWLADVDSDMEQWEHIQVQPPTIEDQTLVYWYYAGTPGPMLMRDRLDLETLEFDTSRIGMVKD